MARGPTLLHALLNVLATVTPASGGGISPDGSAAYVPTLYGYSKIALPSVALIERVRLTEPGSSRITAFPEGDRLFLWDDANGTVSGRITRRWSTSLISQCFDRIERRRLLRRPDAEEQADRRT